MQFLTETWFEKRTAGENGTVQLQVKMEHLSTAETLA